MYLKKIIKFKLREKNFYNLVLNHPIRIFIENIFTTKCKIFLETKHK